MFCLFNPHGCNPSYGVETIIIRHFMVEGTEAQRRSETAQNSNDPGCGIWTKPAAGLIGSECTSVTGQTQSERSNAGLLGFPYLQNGSCAGL